MPYVLEDHGLGRLQGLQALPMYRKPPCVQRAEQSKGWTYEGHYNFDVGNHCLRLSLDVVLVTGCDASLATALAVLAEKLTVLRLQPDPAQPHKKDNGQDPTRFLEELHQPSMHGLSATSLPLVAIIIHCPAERVGPEECLRRVAESHDNEGDDPLPGPRNEAWQRPE